LQLYLHDRVLGSGEVRVVDDEEVIGWLKLLLNHSQSEKMVDFKEFLVKWNGLNSNAYYIRHFDGSEVDFSYNWTIRCYSPLGIRKRLPNHICDFQDACRNEIRNEILQYQITHNVPKGYHVDHYPVSFLELCSTFYQSLKDIEKVPVIQDSLNIRYLSEPYKSLWHQWHSSKTTYRILPESQNTKNGSYGFTADWYKLITEKKDFIKKTSPKCLI